MNGSIPILVPSLVAISIGGVLGLLAFFAGRKRPASFPHLRRAVFRYRLPVRLFALGATVTLPTAITFLVLLFPPVRTETLSVAGAYLVVGMLCSLLLWESAWYYITLDAKGIAYRSPWRGFKSFPWDDVSLVSYSAFNMWFLIRFKDGDKVRVPIFVGNLKELLHRIESHLPADALRRARKGYEKVGRPFPAMVNDPILEARPPR